MKRAITKKWWMPVLVLAALQPAWSQPSDRTLTGIVKSFDESSPLEGVAVYVKGTKHLSGSQPDGIYYINVSPRDSILVFEYEGFRTEEVRIASGTEYNVALKRAVAVVKKPFPQGGWRGSFAIRNDIEVPFNFEIDEQAGKVKAWLLNAEERFEAGAVQQTGDSLFITLDQFDNELAFKIEGEHLKGVLRKQDKSGNPLPVTAQWGRNDRFTEQEKPIANISGKYDVLFKEGNGATKTVGLFTQTGNRVKATFLRTTGDSRFLEGSISGNTIFLSSFIGSSPAYYKATVNADGTITGAVIGARSELPFSGVRNDKAALPDPYTLTFLKPGYTSFEFSLPDLEGKTVSLKDAKFKNKVVVITITGTWCPNCIDEAAFLAPWYKENKKRGVEAIAIHYERNLDSAFLQKVIGRFRSRHGIDYQEVVGGLADKKKVAESLPALNSFLAFPTILFIDKKGNVAKIYTGFTGPATGEYYEQFKKEFNQEIDRLVKQ